MKRIWYLVLSRSIRSREESAPRRREHLDWLLDLHRTGRCLFSGPAADFSCGIYVLLAPGLEEARRMADADPFHRHGDRAAEVFEWNVQRALRMNGPSVEELAALAVEGREDS